MTTGLILRDQVRDDDIDAVREITESTGFFNPAEVHIAVELIQDRVRNGSESDYKFLFADLQRRPVGFTAYGRIDGTLCSFDLYWIVTCDDRRGSGVGTQLLIETEASIRRLGGGRVYVETSSRDQYESTRRFYAHRGYRLEATLKDFYAPKDDKVYFVKSWPQGAHDIANANSEPVANS